LIFRRAEQRVGLRERAAAAEVREAAVAAQRAQQQQQQQRRRRTQRRSVHRILESGCGVIINRDVNSTRNMWRVVISWFGNEGDAVDLTRRPPHLSRW
jgi:hypothetical protein